MVSNGLAWTAPLAEHSSGPVVRIAPKTLVISDPSTIRRVLGVNSPYLRGPWFDSLRTDPHTTSVVSERDPKKHQLKRQILAAGLAGKDVPGSESIVDMHVSNLMEVLSKKQATKPDGSIEVDLSKLMPYLSLDIITHLCLGEPFGNVESDSDRHGLLQELSSGMVAQQYIASLLEFKSCLFWLGSLPLLRQRMFPTAKRPTGIGKIMQVCTQRDIRSNRSLTSR
jgi:cytochrome P450